MGGKVELLLARRRGKVQARKDFEQDKRTHLYLEGEVPPTPLADDAFIQYLKDSLEWLNESDD